MGQGIRVSRVGRIARLGAFVALVGASFLVQVGEAAATDFTVTNGNDSGPGSLRQAFADASTTPGDDRVIVDPGVGTVTLTTGGLVHSPGDNAALELQGNGVTIQQTTFNAFVILNLSSGMLTVDNATVTGGNGINGFGIVSNPGSVALTNSTVRNNASTSNTGTVGGVGTFGSLTITNSTVRDNTATATGSGATAGVTGKGVAVTNSTIRNNTATATGSGFANGGVASGSTVTVTNSTIRDNTATATGSGPALGGAAGSPLTVSDSTISGNAANSSGGPAAGGLGSLGNVTLSGSSVSGNSASGTNANGGVGSASTVTVTNSTVRDNTASVIGSGIAVGGAAGSPLTVTDSTISANAANTSAGPAAGGLASGGNVTLKGSTVSGNSASGTNVGGVGALGDVSATNSTITVNTNGGIGANRITLIYVTVVENSGTQIRSVDSGSRAGSLTSFGSIVAKPTGGGSNCTFGPAGTTTSNGYNFSDDASGAVGCKFSDATDLVGPGNDPQLGPLANNGGPTQTRMPAPTSPVVDVIPVSSCNFAGVTVDQRGVSRPVGPRCDIGSVEIAGVPQTKDDCKNGGWQNVVDDQGQPFKNQGDCVSFVNNKAKD